MEVERDYRDGEIQNVALQVLVSLEARQLRKLWKLEGDILLPLQRPLSEKTLFSSLLATVLLGHYS
jgi:hypothetical protein